MFRLNDEMKFTSYLKSLRMLNEMDLKAKLMFSLQRCLLEAILQTIR